MSQPPQSPQHTFGLGALFELIAGVALFLALVTQLEWFGWIMALTGSLTIAIADGAAFACQRPRWMQNLWCCLIAILVLVLIVALTLPAVSSALEGGRRVQCSNNLRQLGLATSQLPRHVHGYFPPAYVADADGKPMHSWRVLILPHLEKDALFKNTT